MKTLTLSIKAALAISATAALAGCGLRGDLERPPPIFSKPPAEEALIPVDAAVKFAAIEVEANRAYFNSLGGEIPVPAPTNEVEQSDLGEVSPG